jgi:hypothetical protein
MPRRCDAKVLLALGAPIIPFFLLFVIGCGGDEADCDRKQTNQVLGIEVSDFPGPEGVEGFEVLPEDAKVLKFSLSRQRFSGTAPRRSQKEPSETLSMGGTAGRPISVSERLVRRKSTRRTEERVPTGKGVVSHARTSYLSCDIDASFVTWNWAVRVVNEPAEWFLHKAGTSGRGGPNEDGS